MVLESWALRCQAVASFHRPTRFPLLPLQIGCDRFRFYIFLSLSDLPTHIWSFSIYGDFSNGTNGNRLGARVWIFENGNGSHLLICWRKWLIRDSLEFNQIGYLSGNRMIASKIIEKIFFLWNFFNFLMNNRIKSWENLKTCNDFLRSWVTGTELNFW